MNKEHDAGLEVIGRGTGVPDSLKALADHIESAIGLEHLTDSGIAILGTLLLNNRSQNAAIEEAGNRYRAESLRLNGVRAAFDIGTAHAELRGSPIPAARNMAAYAALAARGAGDSIVETNVGRFVNSALELHKGAVETLARESGAVRANHAANEIIQGLAVALDCGADLAESKWIHVQEWRDHMGEAAAHLSRGLHIDAAGYLTKARDCIGALSTNMVALESRADYHKGQADSWRERAETAERDLAALQSVNSENATARASAERKSAAYRSQRDNEGARAHNAEQRALEAESAAIKAERQLAEYRSILALMPYGAARAYPAAHKLMVAYLGDMESE